MEEQQKLLDEAKTNGMSDSLIQDILDGMDVNEEWLKEIWGIEG